MQPARGSKRDMAEDQACCELRWPIGKAPPADLTVNNNAQQQMQLLPLQQRRGTSRVSCPSTACHQRATKVMTTFAEYAKFLEMARSASNSTTMPEPRSSEMLDSKMRQSIFHRPQLTTFAEYQKLSMGTRPATHPTNAAFTVGSDPRRSVQLADDSEAAALADDAAVLDNDEGEDTCSSETRRPSGCCACCSRSRRDPPDTTGRRKRRLVGQEGATTGVPNRVSISLEDDAEMSDVKDMDPTITLMPYVLFESERAKVLYQAISMDEAELLKRAINLHANDLYKKVLMRLHMYRYLRLFKESVVRQIMSKKIVLGQDCALAASILGIDISDDSKGGDGASSSTALNVGMAFDPQPTATPNSAKPTDTAASISRKMFKPAPKFSDQVILDLLNSGKVIDVTGRASLESLVSLPTTKIGQRRSK